MRQINNCGNLYCDFMKEESKLIVLGVENSCKISGASFSVCAYNSRHLKKLFTIPNLTEHKMLD